MDLDLLNELPRLAADILLANVSPTTALALLRTSTAARQLVLHLAKRITYGCQGTRHQAFLDAANRPGHPPRVVLEVSKSGDSKIASLLIAAAAGQGASLKELCVQVWFWYGSGRAPSGTSRQ